MESNKNNWTLGEIANLPRMEKMLKQGSYTSYMHYIESHYICIREANKQNGIKTFILCPFSVFCNNNL